MSLLDDVPSPTVTVSTAARIICGLNTIMTVAMSSVRKKFLCCICYFLFGIYYPFSYLVMTSSAALVADSMALPYSATE